MTNPLAVLAIADPSLRQRLGKTLTGLRWSVVEAAGGAEALAHLERAKSQAVILDRWLPDLDVGEFFREIETCYPDVDLISVDGSLQSATAPRGVRHGELMHAIRTSQEWDGAAHVTAVNWVTGNKPMASLQPGGIRSPKFLKSGNVQNDPDSLSNHPHEGIPQCTHQEVQEQCATVIPQVSGDTARSKGSTRPGYEDMALPEFIGTHPAMIEVSRRIRLVAPRSTPVLIQGPSGTGKELVARALHRLSPRSHRPFVVLNCAAIPESLLEAELFGHTRGAFTGAVQGRVGRIESANGGTLFLDEIGEMPLALQSKLLRFLEAGEVQRVGDNEPFTVDVRVIAATHQPLAQRVKQGSFREDVFYRLSVFLIKTPALCEHAEDLPLLANFLMSRLCVSSPVKHLEPSALERLKTHPWPGNVRELAHVIERAYILAESRSEVGIEEIEFESVDANAAKNKQMKGVRDGTESRLCPGKGSSRTAQVLERRRKRCISRQRLASN